MKLGYIPQLDGLRAFAVSAVLVSHFLPTSTFNAYAPWGRFGVLLFFVLSGFLITLILLGERDRYQADGTRPWPAIARFYIRRVLRIFPIYFGTLLVCTLLDYRPVTDYLVWHVTYLTNYSKPFLGGAYEGSAHLWTLCVEEQFYLLWPFAVMLLPKTWLSRILIGLIFTALCYKVLGSLLGLDWQQLTRPLPGCLDSLGLGALLAVFWNEPQKYANQNALLFKVITWIGLPSLIITLILFGVLESPKSNTIFTTLVDVSASLCFVLLIHNAARNPSTFMGKVLGLVAIRYVGKISYGIYLYHLFLSAAVLPSFLRYLNAPPSLASGWSGFFILTASTLLLASVSWHAFEKPLNGLKKHFPYTAQGS